MRNRTGLWRDAPAGETEAYLTVYLALIMTVLLSLCLALIEGTRCHAVYLESECVMDIGMNSVLAEYHRELLNQYNLFAIDASYGTAYADRQNVAGHLKGYLERNFSNEGLFLGEYLYRDFLGLSTVDTEVTKMSLLTDEDGEVFRRAAVEAVKDDVGITGLAMLQNWLAVVEGNGLLSVDIEQQQSLLSSQIEEVTAGAFENPMKKIEEVQREGILKRVVPEEQQLSGKELRKRTLYSSRAERGEVSRGNMELPDVSGWNALEEQFWFQEYLLAYMGSYRQPKEEGALSYQLEFLVAGKESDVENLRSVAGKLCGMRASANALYLSSNAEKRGEAELAATVMATLLAIPEGEELLEAALILGWSYMEGLYDVKTLLAGGRVPLMKDDSTWHYGLQSALQGEEESVETAEGLSYEDYLRILLMTKRGSSLCAGAMDLVEADIRLTRGNQAFRLDACIVSLEACGQIDSKYGYHVDIVRSKSY